MLEISIFAINIFKRFSFMKKLTKDEFVKNARDVHGGKYDYSQAVYVNGKTKVCIVCPTHGEFFQTPNAHISLRQGCPKCANERIGDYLRSSTEEFIEKAREVHGDKYDYSRAEYCGNKKRVRIICPTHGEFMQTPNSHLSGEGCKLCRSDNMKKLLFGVGIFDGYIKRCDCYSHWSHMLRRCYDERSLEKYPNYKGCSVCEEWHTYSSFKKWFDINAVEGWHLDKDILIKGNKLYSPNTCCFVPPQINSLLVNRRRFRGNELIGVHRNSSGTFFALCSKDCKSERLGTFNSEHEAFLAYKKAKEENIKRVADIWRDKIEEKVYVALCNYIVEEDD